MRIPIFQSLREYQPADDDRRHDARRISDQSCRHGMPRALYIYGAEINRNHIECRFGAAVEGACHARDEAVGA